jgi:hypothetical protein
VGQGDDLGDRDLGDSGLGDLGLDGVGLGTAIRVDVHGDSRPRRSGAARAALLIGGVSATTAVAVGRTCDDGRTRVLLTYFWNG